MSIRQGVDFIRTAIEKWVMLEESEGGSTLEELNHRLTKLSYRHVRLYQDDLGLIWTHDRDDGRACVETLEDAEQYVRHLEHEDRSISVMT
jgi:hypothetical protein